MIFKLKGSVDISLLNQIRSSWNKNERKITKEISLLTGISIETDSIVCYLDNSTTNGYYGSRTITLGVKGTITKDDALMVIAHELFHIYYWRKIKKMKLTNSSPGNESKKEWKIAEVSGFLLTSEPCLMKHWPKAKVYVYPEFTDTYKKMKCYWQIGDFAKFIRCL